MDHFIIYKLYLSKVVFLKKELRRQIEVKIAQAGVITEEGLHEGTREPWMVSERGRREGVMTATLWNCCWGWWRKLVERKGTGCEDTRPLQREERHSR